MAVPESFKNRKTVRIDLTENASDDTGESFSVLAYNILAECHVPLWDYSYTKADPKTLALSYRHPVLMKEIAYLDSDIICMQEVGPRYFKETLESDMKSLGYQGIFVRKKEVFDNYDEGGATFWKISKFSLEDSQAFYLGEEVLKLLETFGFKDDSTGNENIKKRFCDRADVLLVARLKSVLSGEMVVVGNTHVVWGEAGLTDVRAIQCRCSKMLLSKYLAEESIPCIYCGDFNSIPESLAYAMALGRQPDTEFRKKLVPEFNGQELFPLYKQILQSFTTDDLPMSSAYYECLGKEPLVTCFDGVQTHTLDYIFYGSKSSKKTLVSKSVIDVSPPDTWTNTLPPDDHFPSDHLPMFCQFQFCL